MKKDVVIIGAGPAGLTAGLELLRAGWRDVVILEASSDLGGISKTINHNGNRIDIGGHRFFSKSDWVMDWWRQLMPVAAPADATEGNSCRLAYQGKSRQIGVGGGYGRESDADVMLLRNRLSRIYFSGKFLDYPLKPNLDMVRQLGMVRCTGFAASYAVAKIFPRAPEVSLEDFLINRFGRKLYHQFFKEYTEKVWGVPCMEITSEWGAQRIKSISVGKLVESMVRKVIGGGGANPTSLIENFLYPKYGPGQMWETAGRKFEMMGGQIVRDAKVTELVRQENRVTAVVARGSDGSPRKWSASHVISTMPIKELVDAMNPRVPVEVAEVARGLQYRDFITVGLLYRKMCRTSASIHPRANYPGDNWIYIQEPGVKVGRLQIFNNWSPYMVADPEKAWVGLEFFAKDGDDLWAMSDGDLKQLALHEMEKLGLAMQSEALDAVVVRMPKAYPGYFGSAYSRFDVVRTYLDAMPNLFLVGRNGMHRYNNQDHSMLSAKCAVEHILHAKTDKREIWDINVDDSYHEDVADEMDASTAQDARQRYA
jgi:protoporphyrinogen oxidase